jgi:hypothetical protein
MPDLQEELRTLAEGRADEAVGDFDSVVSTARTRRHRRTAGWSAALAVAVVAVVGSQVVSRPDAGPVAPPTVVGPELVLTPSTVSPGERFTATDPEGVSRGLGFRMRSVKPTPHSYALRAQAPGVTLGPASWGMTDGRPNTGLIMPLYQGPGPFTLETPEGAESGSYRVCSGELCGLLIVR